MPSDPASTRIDLPLASVSAVLPAFDEEGNVEAAVRGVLEALARVAGEVEVVLVDDGSTDRTGALADALAAGDERVRVVHHEGNLGYGAAMRSGFGAARHEWVFFTDADLQFDPAQIEAFAPLAERHDVVAGYRHARQDPAHRRLMAWAWNQLVSRTLGVPLRDVNCAFKLMRRSVLARVPLHTNGAMACSELAVGLDGVGARIVELPVDHRPRSWGSSSGGRPDVVLRALRDWLRFRRVRAVAHESTTKSTP